jgi:hypothetical protein
MEQCMPEPAASETASRVTAQDQEIRERVKELTSQVLQRGQFDPEAVRDIVRAVIGGSPGNVVVSGTEARELFADAIRRLDEALVMSASAVHDALQQLASRGKDFTDNDLKEALVSLKRLEQDYAAAASRVAEAMTSNLRREIMELTVHAQNIGVEASAGAATMISRVAEGVGATSGMKTMRDASVRMVLVASGVLAGVADALRDRPETKSGP